MCGSSSRRPMVVSFFTLRDRFPGARLIIAVLEFITMGLDNGIVLPGVTRDSFATLLKDHGDGKETPFKGSGLPDKIRVVERDIAMSEIEESSADGTLKG